jgi:ribosomal-protein-alanine N-acetyltransferase
MIETSRLVLEDLTVSHAKELFSGLQNPRLYTFLDEPPPPSIEFLETRYATIARRRSPDDREIWLNWAVKLRDPDSYVGYIQATIQEQNVALLAFVLFCEHWGHSYARESVAALIDHLRCQFSVTTFCATVDGGNKRSITLLKAIGFARMPANADCNSTRSKPNHFYCLELH